MADILMLVLLAFALTGLGVWVGLMLAAEARDLARSAHDPDKEEPPQGWEEEAVREAARFYKGVGK